MGRVEKTVFFAATPVVLYVNFESFLSMTKTIKTFLVENCHFGDSNMQQITINEFELWRFTRSVVGHVEHPSCHHTNPFEGGGGFPFIIQDLQMVSDRRPLGTTKQVHSTM